MVLERLMKTSTMTAIMMPSIVEDQLAPKVNKAPWANLVRLAPRVGKGHRANLAQWVRKANRDPKAQLVRLAPRVNKAHRANLARLA